MQPWPKSIAFCIVCNAICTFTVWNYHTFSARFCNIVSAIAVWPVLLWLIGIGAKKRWLLLHVDGGSSTVALLIEQMVQFALLHWCYYLVEYNVRSCTVTLCSSADGRCCTVALLTKADVGCCTVSLLPFAATWVIQQARESHICFWPPPPWTSVLFQLFSSKHLEFKEKSVFYVPSNDD